MTETEELTPAMTQAVKAAEEAAVRAEKAAVRPRYWLMGGLLFALVGAVLAFALKDSGASVLGVRLQPFGGVLFAAGVLLIAGGAISSMMSGSGGNAPNAEGIKSIAGLIAVVVGITAVTALTIVTLTQLGHSHKESIIAVTTSAFGIISAVVGAYLGIKISADTNSKASEEASKAAVAKHESNRAKRQIAAMKATAEEIVPPEQAAQINAAGEQAGEGVPPPVNPPKGSA